MLYLEKTVPHRITVANYTTIVNAALHPERVLFEHDFLYILDGAWEIVEEDTAYEIKKDDLLILASGRHHYGKAPCTPGTRHMFLHVQPTPAEQQQCSGTPAPGRRIPAAQKKADRTASPKMDNMENMLLCPSLLHCQSAPGIRKCFHEIIAAGWTPTPERENRLSLLFSLLLCEISDLLSASPGQAATDPMVEEVCLRIRTTPQTFFSAKEIAAEYFICERTLNNRFQKACGKSFHAFQMETRLEMVRQFLLSQPQAKLHEAALNYGFYDEFHLSKAFKSRFGMPPSQYRSRMRCSISD